MKRFTLLATALMAAATMSAQSVLWNGDDKELGSDGGFWNRAEPTVVEEDGNKCLKVTLKANPSGWDQEHHNAALPVGDANFKGLRRLTFRLKMADKHNVMVQLEGKDGAYNAKRIFWYDTPNEWQVMTYEFSVGPDNEKITDADNNVIAIWPYEETADGEGKTVYIDDIQLEGPMVGDAAVRTLEDGALSSQQVIVTGSLRKGVYQNTWDGDWHTEAYDDYSLLLSKLSASVCFLNLTGAAVTDGDGPQLRLKNPNLLILSPTDFFDTDNVIRWDGEKNITPNMLMDEAYPFYTPIDFTATAVKVTRKVYDGTNTFCLPFYVGEAEIGGTMALYKEKSATQVTFTKQDHADANVPFLMTGCTAKDELSFTDKGVVNTPDYQLGSDFIGVYQETGCEGLWGIGSDGTFVKGGTGAKVQSFHAYLNIGGSSAPSLVIEGATGISTAARPVDNAQQSVYDLQGRRVGQLAKGVYVINHKKVVVR